MAERLRCLRSRTVVLPWSDIDTDQIFPARFLTTTSREGLGRHAFADRRLLPGGHPDPSFPLNAVDIAAHRILVAGSNFGCGSSREHATWALLDLGIRAVVSTHFADIFRVNALKNGLLAVVVDDATQRALMAKPGLHVELDVETRELRYAGRSVELTIEPFARHCLLHGVDELDYLLEQSERIAEFERATGR